VKRIGTGNAICRTGHGALSPTSAGKAERREDYRRKGNDGQSMMVAGASMPRSGSSLLQAFPKLTFQTFAGIKTVRTLLGVLLAGGTIGRLNPCKLFIRCVEFLA